MHRESGPSRLLGLVALALAAILMLAMTKIDSGSTSLASAESSPDYSITGPTANAAAGSSDDFLENLGTALTAPTQVDVYDLCIRGPFDPVVIRVPYCAVLDSFRSDSGSVSGQGRIGIEGLSVVTQADVGVGWHGYGRVKFREGPGHPPLGKGSLWMTSDSGSGQAYVYTEAYTATLLTEVNSMTYATYRDHKSTGVPEQYPALTMQVDYVGDGHSSTMLIWEPYFSYGLDNLHEDTWQTWNTMTSSEEGGWWSTKAIPGVCASDCVVPWNTILTFNPDAELINVGIRIASSREGGFEGAVDALHYSFNGTTKTYDFELESYDPAATFTFDAEYKEGASLPAGTTTFLFPDGNIDFQSTNYDRLSFIGNDSAQIKGEGTNNGAGSYQFMIWVSDKDPDTFRIKIEEQSGKRRTIYDNGPDQAIAEGDIVVRASQQE